MHTVNENTPFRVPYAALPHVKETPEWVRNLPEARDGAVRQLFVAACMGEDRTTASVSLHERAEDGAFRQLLSTPAFIGRNGLCRDADHTEGCGMTPAGVFHFTKAFGIADDPGCALPYTKVDEDCYWSGDMREGMRYNEMVRLSELPGLDVGVSEHLIDYAEFSALVAEPYGFFAPVSKVPFGALLVVSGEKSVQRVDDSGNRYSVLPPCITAVFRNVHVKNPSI